MDSSMVKPLGHKLVIQPDQPVTASEGGILIPDAYRDTPAMSGIVLRLGTGAQREKTIRRAAIARCLAILDDAEREGATPSSAVYLAREEMVRYMAEAEDLGHVCEVGQRVIFPMEAGHEIVLNEDTDQAVVIVNEDSVLAVYDAEEQAA